MSEGLHEPNAIARRSPVIVALGIVVLIGAGIVLSSSWFVDFPPTVLGAAWLVALVAMVTVTVVGWRGARRAGVGFLASIKAALRSLGQFILFFS